MIGRSGERGSGISVLAARLDGDDDCSTIISCYSPTNASDKTDLITFYNKLSSLVYTIPNHNILIISGDMNAQIGKDENSKLCLHKSPNRNGEHLTDLSLENKLTCTNIKFQKREENNGSTPTQKMLKHR